ncbi:hypothetical protein SUGI_0684220 [Cryptomeria japonica]|nr:hypothetical protein SUGI_0684220 [Cryptomeria japonica]
MKDTSKHLNLNCKLMISRVYHDSLFMARLNTYRSATRRVYMEIEQQPWLEESSQKYEAVFSEDGLVETLNYAEGGFEDLESFSQNLLSLDMITVIPVRRYPVTNDIVLDTIAYNTFIKAKLDAGKIEDAINLYADMQAAGVVPSLQTYESMISVFGRAGELQSAIRIFNSLLTSGITVNEKAYSNMIGCYGTAGIFKMLKTV